MRVLVSWRPFHNIYVRVNRKCVACTAAAAAAFAVFVCVCDLIDVRVEGDRIQAGQS